MAKNQRHGAPGTVMRCSTYIQRAVQIFIEVRVAKTRILDTQPNFARFRALIRKILKTQVFPTVVNERFHLSVPRFRRAAGFVRAAYPQERTQTNSSLLRCISGGLQSLRFTELNYFFTRFRNRQSVGSRAACLFKTNFERGHHAFSGEIAGFEANMKWSAR